MNIPDVINQCYNLYLFDHSTWVNLSDGFFMNTDTGIQAAVSFLYPSIKLGTNFQGNLVCKRKSFSPHKLRDGKIKSDWPLQKVTLVPKNKEKYELNREKIALNSNRSIRSIN